MGSATTEISSLYSGTIDGSEAYIDVMRTGLKQIGACEVLKGYDKVIVKPNIVNGSPPPVTTDVNCVAALVDLLKDVIDLPISVADGSGEGDTIKNMKKNGYGNIGVPLVDLDSLPCKVFGNPRATILKEVYLPEYLDGAAIISVPSAKDHTMTDVSLGLKNMIGCLPARHYGGYWSYKKSRLHMGDIDAAVADLILYLEPHLTVIDARLGLKGGHLWGTVPEPPLGKVFIGKDVLEVDREGARLLGHDPDRIKHLVLAERLRE
ncbi:MAG: DUF362 domain-containing protein [Planctomycetota bacterium]